MNDTIHDDWDPRDPSVQQDQRRAYDDMRERCPVAHSEFMGWSLFRHQDVIDVLADPRTYSSASRHPAIPNGMDPPSHRQYRDALASHFSTDRMAGLEPRCREIAADLLEPMLVDGHAEFVDAFATPFALKVLCAFLGWPAQLWECLGGWTHGNQEAAFTRDPAAGRALARLFAEHVEANLAAHRSRPHAGDDVTDRLLATSVDGRPLDDEQLVNILRNWTAGHGTVSAALSILVLYLAERQELQQRLRADPSLIPAAIEEILRSDDPLVANRRTTTGEVEIGGRTIPAGSSLTLMWIAANRDPRAFEDPESIELRRGIDAGLVWGRGIHLCLGAPLARLEMRVGLEELLERTQRFEIAGAAPRRTIYPSNGLVALTLRSVEGRPVVRTIGHGTRTTDELAALLSAAGVTTLIDVRRYPSGRRQPHLSRERLSADLPERGVAYEWWGDALGGRRSVMPASVADSSWRSPAFAAYSAYMSTPAFLGALAELEERASAGEVLAIMCAETVWWRCHRRLIADALTLDGFAAEHLIDRVPGRRHQLSGPSQPRARRFTSGAS